MTIKAFVFDAYGTLYDVHSVVAIIEEVYPGHGELVTQIWRLKQLEYSWFHSMMGQFVDFRIVTREALAYTLRILGLPADATLLDRLVAGYDHLTPYPEAAAALAGITQCQRVILSNGSQSMLDALVRHSDLGRHLDVVISVDAAKAFKPDPRTYALVTENLGVRPSEVMFVTSNGFDVAGARAFGFQVARIVRVTPEALCQELSTRQPIGAAAMYRALRSQQEALGQGPTIEAASLLELLALA